MIYQKIINHIKFLCNSIQDFRKFSLKPIENEFEKSPLKPNKFSNEWEIIDEPLITDPSSISTEEIAKTKKDKYQGLLNFAAEVKAEEQKSNITTKPAGFLRFPNFLKVFNKMSLSPGKKRKIQHIEEEAKKNRIDLNKLDLFDKKDPLFRRVSREFIEDVIEDPLEKKREEFMFKFPVKRLNRRNSYHHFYKIDVVLEKFPGRRRFTKSKTININNDEEEKDLSKIYRNKTALQIEPVIEKPVQKKRKLSDKNVVDNNERLSFIQALRSEITSENNETINEILNKIEESIKNEIKKGQVILSPDKQPNKTPMAKHKGFWDELWEDKAKTIKEKSPYGHFPSYKLRCIIIKGGDDLRQEILAMQIIMKFQEIFKQACLSLYLRPYEILVTSANSGILEFVPNTIALDGLKKKYPGMSLLQIYTKIFDFDFEEAQKNFIESLAAYSLVCYLLQIKDRCTPL